MVAKVSYNLTKSKKSFVIMGKMIRALANNAIKKGEMMKDFLEDYKKAFQKEKVRVSHHSP